MTSGDAMIEFRTTWLDVVYRVGENDFAPVAAAGKLPTQARHESEAWHKRVFKPDAGAHRADANAKIGAHVARQDTVDLIRFAYDVGELKLTITESAAFLHALCPQLPASFGAEPLEQAAALAVRILRLDKPLRLMMLQGDPRYRSFSSAPQLGYVRIDNWSDRIDGDVRQPGVALLIYKRHVDFDDIANLSLWFDADFRSTARRP